MRRPIFDYGLKRAFEGYDKMKKGCPYGSHRVIESVGILPQMAWRVDNNMEEIYDNEILVDVNRLNIDAVSFRQIKEQAGEDRERIKQIILETVATRGKQHNPVTGSGGMFTGTVRMIGDSSPRQTDLEVGDRIASLVSLSLTPLRINKIKRVRKEIDQLEIEGQAILFERTVYAKLPPDMSESLVTAVLDVAGAPAQTARLVKPGDTVLIIGAGGKSGMLCSYEAKRKSGPNGFIIGAGHSSRSTQRIKDLGLCDRVIQVDATKPLEVQLRVSNLTNTKMADITINCANVPDTELGCILATKQKGLIYFFNMATDFNKAALGAEGLGQEVTMIIGSGYVKDHAKVVMNILEESPEIRRTFEEIYGHYHDKRPMI